MGFTTTRAIARLVGATVAVGFAVTVTAVGAGCSSSRASTAQEAPGQLSLPLVAVGTSGSTYRLVGRFSITGPDRKTIVTDGSESILSAELAPGTYDVQLMPGWKLSKQAPAANAAPNAPNGAETPMPTAKLTSANPVRVVVQAGTIAAIRFDFDVNGDDVAFGNGALNIGANFNDIPDLVTLELIGNLRSDANVGLTLQAMALVDGRGLTRNNLCAPLVAILPTARAAGPALESIFGTKGGSFCLQDGGASVRITGQAPDGSSFVLSSALQQPVASLPVLVSNPMKSGATTIDVVLPPGRGGPLRYAGSLSAGPKAPADPACRPKACVTDANCPGSGQLCAAGQCYQRSFFCLSNVPPPGVPSLTIEANARGEQRSCGTTMCRASTGSCIETPEDTKDCQPGFAFLGGHCVDTGAQGLPNEPAEFVAAPAAVCAKSCAGGCAANEICSSGYCYYAASYCTAPAFLGKVRTYVPAAGTYVESTCGGGYVCNEARGECLAGSCRTSRDCQPGFGCDTKDGEGLGSFTCIPTVK